MKDCQKVLLVSDRSHEGAQLQRLLSGVGPCTLVALHQPAAQTKARELLICDVALDNAVSFELLRAALGHYRGAADVPMLMLLRDPSQLTRAQATALGPTQMLPCQASKTDLLSAATSLIARPGPAAAPDIRAGVQDAGSALADLFGAAGRNQPLSPATLQRGGKAVLTAIGQAKIQAWLDVVWTYDDLTYQHCLLVAGLTAAFALELALSPAVQRVLSQAALVHDIGKSQVPLHILNKPSRLTAAEMSIVRSHADAGHRMLVTQPGVDPQLLDVVRHHHEYLDGSGYPDGLDSPRISRLVRIVTICDIYAALIERRAYKKPLPPKTALAHLDDLGPKLDQPLVKAFRNVVRDT